jgi:hypothetical protein
MPVTYGTNGDDTLAGMVEAPCAGIRPMTEFYDQGCRHGFRGRNGRRKTEA